MEVRRKPQALAAVAVIAVWGMEIESCFWIRCVFVGASMAGDGDETDEQLNKFSAIEPPNEAREVVGPGLDEELGTLLGRRAWSKSADRFVVFDHEESKVPR